MYGTLKNAGTIDYTLTVPRQSANHVGFYFLTAS